MYSGAADGFTCIGMAWALRCSVSSASARGCGVAQELGAGRVGHVLALPRDGDLDDHRRDRRQDDRGERPDQAERAVVVVAAEEQRELEEVGDGRDRAGDHRGDARDEDVAVLDVGDLVREDALQLAAGQGVQDALP